ncbi:AAA family ATPase [Chryseobacterium sp. BIGb0232]|uniref:AAA family ATPase n=1 Tax=Chryseobacterium sp. BIGb0232 TaxID=2940598 RepID=UPI000F4640D4|nr:AAA family ATPase [Chryseobacterium sp. BIGb0232]MCS4304125.1 putative ATPase [Chryseobacterium sp. BIGb0232]ROS17704.1 putative ATPase [Chryseobacterium nakagawai]
MKNNNITKKLYVITGGPGAGKTTLINELNRLGFTTAPEEGRRIIKEQLLSNGDGVPWINKEIFAGLMFDASVKTFNEMMPISGIQPVFFDRGILDTIGYLRLEGIPVPRKMEITAREMEYNKNVFILPPWKEIYENDSERKQTQEVAEHTFECMYEIYREYGYNVIEIPRVTVEQRVRFVLNAL